MKKLLCNTLIIIMLMGVCFNGCFDFGCLSFSYGFYSYAEAVSVDRDDLVSSFRDYCMSRNLVIDGTVAGSALSWTGNMLDDLCKSIGVDITYLQAQINKELGGNLGVRWLINATGMNIYNRLFAELLQREQLSVGSEDVNKLVMSTEWFTDADGNGCMVYVFKNTAGQGAGRLIKKGSVYKYSGNVLRTMAESGNATVTAHLTENQTQTNSVVNTNTSTHIVNGSAEIGVYNSNYGYGGLCIFRSNANSSDLYYGGWQPHSNSDVTNVYNGYIVKITDGDTEPTDITVKTPPDKKILPDPPEEPTAIYPGGGTDDNPDDPSDDPLEPYDPDKPFPDTPDNPTPDPGVHGSPGSDGTITIPDFNFDIPDINWSLDGLQHKFPFSLPFDLYNACKLLNAEPQTPELDYTVDLVVYQWPIQMDLHWLDPAARVIRIFELLAFVVGLILITRHLIGG